MKKRMTSFLMALVMVVGMCIPASAVETGPETLELIPVENMGPSTKVTVINDDVYTEEAMPLEIGSAPQDELPDDATAYAIRNTAYPKQVRIYPIVLNTQTAEAFIINSISRSASWTNGAQYESLSLSPDQVQAFINQVTNFLLTNSSTSGSTWALIGWYVDATVLLTAERPRRVEVAPYFPQAGTKYETETLAISSQTVELHLSQEFYFAPNMNLEAFYYLGFDGNFYYTYTSGSNQGKEGGTNFSIGVMMNDT